MPTDETPTRDEGHMRDDGHTHDDAAPNDDAARDDDAHSYDEAVEEDRPPSRWFTILFAVAMFIIAIGYVWVWQAKTSRVVVEPAPAIFLDTITSSVPGYGSADDIALRDTIAAYLKTVPELAMPASLNDMVPPPEGRPPRRAFELDGGLERAEDGSLELALRRTDARTDALVYIYRVRGSTLSEVAQRMAVQIAMSFGLPYSDLPAAPAGDHAVSPIRR